MRSYSNNFDFFRFTAATMVIVGHAYALLALPGTPVFFNVAVSTYAVKVFFVLSGYLVVKSWVHDPHAVRFMVKRLLRIMPALVGVVLFAAFVLGPIVTTQNLGDYFTDFGFRYYFNNILLYISYTLPGVFEGNLYPLAVNGSLWSLPVEFAMYLAVLFAGIFAFLLGLSFKFIWSVTTCFFLIVNVAIFSFSFTLVDTPYLVIYATSTMALLEIAPYFFVGGCVYIFREYLSLNSYVAFAALTIGYALSLTGWKVELAFIFITSYAIIALGTKSTPIVREFGRFGDLSYGIYLYGFPVAQTLSWMLGHSVSIYVHMVLTILISCVFAYGSWHLIEKRALRLKPRRVDA